MKQAPPSIHETAFDCPHCGAFAEQSWYSVGVNHYHIRDRIPISPDQYTLEDKEINRPILSNIIEGYPTLDSSAYTLSSLNAFHTFVSSCSNCKRISLWHRDNLVYPHHSPAPLANADLPDHIREDYDEASNILNLSPRGAAALLRLLFRRFAKNSGKRERTLTRTSPGWSQRA